MAANAAERVQDWLVDNVFEYHHEDTGAEIGRLENRMLDDLAKDGFSKKDLFDLSIDPHEVMQTYFFSVQDNGSGERD
jgi:hypothetical protein